MNPLVSVIIPNYNHESFLTQRLESVLNQTYANFEIIILDDYSSDHSKAVIEKYRYHKKVKHIIYNDSNSGSPFIQWKKGIALSLGTYIWIAESDDYADLYFLEKVMTEIKNKRDVVICYTDSNIIESGVVDATNRPSIFYKK